MEAAARAVARCPRHAGGCYSVAFVRKGWTMRLRNVAASLLGFAIAAGAQDLKLIPEPRQVEKKSGAFPIGATTRIVVNSAHGAEDRVAAETIADEIESATGHRPAVSSAAALPAAAVIYLTRIGDRSLAQLDAAKMPSDELFKEQGYALDATAAHAVIAGSTAAGVFYGAQTLRQPVLPAGGKVAISAR